MTGDIKHIVIIQSLREREVQSGKDLYDDLIVRMVELSNNGMTHEYLDVGDKLHLIEDLKYINAKSPYIPGGVLIHLEMHGSHDQDGLVLKNYELITWVELVECFREINISTVNKLYITMATCHGRYLYEGVDPEQKSPYSGYISASKEVLLDEVVQDFSQLFESLIAKGNLVEAYFDLDATSNFFYKDSEATFVENIKMVKNQFDSDPAFKQSFYDDVRATLSHYGYDMSDLEIETMRRQAHDSIIRRHRKAFEFPVEE
ncbi:hypothetical protein ACFQZS_14055 [Mucilaginibacter calamicampi]|uniref:Uncharacterized protein n=1 Tax=Mucilaginibacter calamicampi TaxID=1302352 RepID=A0ABW2Z0B3_9SPHI